MTTSLPRITARVDADTQALLSQAAIISGMPSINAFVLSAAVEKAKKIMQYERLLQLSEQDAVMLVNSLGANAKIHSRLRQAAERYDDKNQL